MFFLQNAIKNKLIWLALSTNAVQTYQFII